jgi:hypothetical protein
MENGYERKEKREQEIAMLIYMLLSATKSLKNYDTNHVIEISFALTRG